VFRNAAKPNGDGSASPPDKLRPMSSGVRELRVWQESVSLAGDVIRAIRQSIRRETKSVSDGVMATAIAVGCNIADGFGRHTAAEQLTSYIQAKRALLKLETELAIARQAELIPAGAFTELTARSNQVARLLAGYIVYLERQLAEPDTNARVAPSARRPSAAAASVPLRESLNEVDGAQPSQ
jgi:four helix bundle protein